jgi:hypothetical protein
MLSQVINERNNIVSIKQHLSRDKNINKIKNEYSLKQHFFDPTKSSPPNMFMVKLHMRMSVYDSFTKDDNCDNK